MKTLGQYTEEQINEELFMTLTAVALLGFVCQPLLNTEFAKAIGSGIGNLLSGIGERIKNKKEKKKEDKPDWVPNKKSKTTKKENESDWYQAAQASAQEKINDVKDSDEKKELQSKLDKVKAASVDENGNPVNFEKTKENFEKQNGQSVDDWAKDNDIKTMSKSEFDKTLKTVNSNLEKKSPKELSDMIDKNKEEASKRNNTEKPKEKIEQKEVTDPDTGKKRTLTIHTGERGAQYGQLQGSKNRIYGKQLKQLQGSNN